MDSMYRLARQRHPPLKPANNLVHFHYMIDRLIQAQGYPLCRELREARPDEEAYRPMIDLIPLRKMFDRLRGMEDRQAAGLELERLLWRLFDLYELEPGAGFRVVGQQIDGSFKLNGFVYLVEAKWTRDPVSAKEIQF